MGRTPETETLPVSSIPTHLLPLKDVGRITRGEGGGGKGNRDLETVKVIVASE